MPDGWLVQECVEMASQAQKDRMLCRVWAEQRRFERDAAARHLASIPAERMAQLNREWNA